VSSVERFNPERSRRVEKCPSLFRTHFRLLYISQGAQPCAPTCGGSTGNLRKFLPRSQSAFATACCHIRAICDHPLESSKHSRDSPNNSPTSSKHSRESSNNSPESGKHSRESSNNSPESGKHSRTSLNNSPESGKHSRESSNNSPASVEDSNGETRH
jgi:hypothetical protein